MVPRKLRNTCVVLLVAYIVFLLVGAVLGILDYFPGLTSFPLSPNYSLRKSLKKF